MADFKYNNNKANAVRKEIEKETEHTMIQSEELLNNPAEEYSRTTVKNKTLNILRMIDQDSVFEYDQIINDLGNDRTAVIELLLFYWQSIYPDIINRQKLQYALIGFLKYEESEEMKRWKLWLTSENTEEIIAGSAVWICSEQQITYGEFCFRYHVSPDSRLGKLVLDYLNKRRVNSMASETLKKIEFRFRDNNYSNAIIYEALDEGIASFCVPEFEKNPTLIMTTKSEQTIETKLRTFQSFVHDGTGNLSTEELKTLNLFADGNNFNHAFEITEKPGFLPPKIRIKDITETLLLGFPPLSEATICGENGIWSDHGNRIFEIEVDNISLDDLKDHVEMKINKIDGKAVWEIIELPVNKRKGRNSYYGVLDTKALGDEIRSVGVKESKSKYSCECEFIITKKGYKDEKETFIFTFSITVNNTSCFNFKSKDNCINRNAVVSIDFGTSSTCVAIGSNIAQLVEMSRDDFGKSASNVYEIPTMLRIFNWNKLNKKWLDTTNDKRPVLHKDLYVTDGNQIDEYSDYSETIFDCGHPVKNTRKTDMATLESVITELKMIPKDEKDGVHNVFVPYDSEDIGKIELVSKNNEDETHFDPIAYYCYLLGCAINHPNESNNQIYTKYILTFPVKFDEKIRESLLSSIRKGLMRALPEYLRGKDENEKDLVSIQMKFSEPVACAGAVCGKEFDTKDGKPVPFGIFDFGGGTVDFSFGMYRDADEETEDYNEAIEIFGTDGDESFGGELLVRKISYWILRDNQEAVSDKKIVFELPAADERIPDGFGTLIQNTQYSRANIRKINETFSRWYLEGDISKLSVLVDDGTETENFEKFKKDKPDFTFTIDGLFDLDGKEQLVEFTVNFEVIDGRLKNEIRRICDIFAGSMKNVFSQQPVKDEMEKFDCDFSDGVTVVLAGNASRHPFVKECLSEKFDSIVLIGENRTDETENKYRVTPKTAVAIGALKLNNMLVKLPNDFSEGVSVSQLYVAREVKGRKEILINRNSSDDGWKRVAKINSNQARIFYSGVLELDRDESWKTIILDFDDEDEGKICYIKSLGNDEIGYIAVPSGSEPESESEIEKVRLR